MNQQPPVTLETLSTFLAGIRRSRKLPQVMPQEPYSAATWWMNHQEKPISTFAEAPEPIHDKDGNLSGWRTPYTDRLIYNLRVFLGMNTKQQAWIVKHIENGIPWRGDSILMYAKIIEHHGEMLKDKDAFISNAKKLARSYQTN